MKKTLAAVAILGAFAGSALADVTVYGKVDMGMSYVAEGDTHSFKMGTGQSSGNRFGLKGAEKISDNVTVGFQLEAGFNADDGRNAGAADDADLELGDTTFHREARLYVATPYGTLHFGRMGTLDSGAGSVNLGGSMSAYGTGWSQIGDARHVITLDTRRDNVVTYQSPAMAGFTAYAQVASGSLEDADENVHEYSEDAVRYYAVGAKYKAGAFDAMFTASQLVPAGEAAERDNYNAYVGYDFGVAKAMLQVGYMEQGIAEKKGVVLSATAPVAGGKLLAEAGYGKETTAAGVERDNMNFGLGYQYTLSKQTYLYTGVGYEENKVDGTGAKTDLTEVIFGICHSF